VIIRVVIGLSVIEILAKFDVLIRCLKVERFEIWIDKNFVLLTVFSMLNFL